MPSIMKSIREEALRELLDEYRELPEDSLRRVEIIADLRALGADRVLRDLTAQTEQ